MTAVPPHPWDSIGDDRLLHQWSMAHNSGNRQSAYQISSIYPYAANMSNSVPPTFPNRSGSVFEV